MLGRRLLRLSSPPVCVLCRLCSPRNIYPRLPPRAHLSASHNAEPADAQEDAVVPESGLATKEGSTSSPKPKSPKSKTSAKLKSQHQKGVIVASEHAHQDEGKDGDDMETTSASKKKLTKVKGNRRARKIAKAVLAKEAATATATPAVRTRKTRRAKEPTVRRVISTAKERAVETEKIVARKTRRAKEPTVQRMKSATKEPAAETCKIDARKVRRAESTTGEPTELGKETVSESMSLKEALLAGVSSMRRKRKEDNDENLEIEILSPQDLLFEPIDIKIPPVPMLAHGLDRVLFNPGVYRLQDPRSRIYNFDPYLEKIMPASEFNFDALSEYKTSSKDEDLLAITRNLGTKFTGSTSSMSGILTHFHYLLSQWRPLRIDALSRAFPRPTDSFSKIQRAPNAIFLRYKNGVYAVDADKLYDKPNIMSWLGNSLEKLLTNPAEEFELYRRSSPEKPPNEAEEGKSFHYSRLGNFLMRSQLDAYDPRLPGTGVFDLKTRAVVTIRMNHREYESGTGYQLQYGQGEWESYEREFYDMCRATILKYSLQVRMGRMDGIFVAYHNIERIFGFQYLGLPDLDYVLHGQSDTTLGDQEFKLSIRLLDELLSRATRKFPETSLRLHFETREAQVPYMYVFAEPVTDEEADKIQNTGRDAAKEFERNVIGVQRDDPQVQKEWQELQGRVDEEVDEDETNPLTEKEDEDEDESNPSVGREEEDETVESEGEESSVVDEVGLECDSSNGDAPAAVDGKGAEAKKNAEDTTPVPEGPLMGWTLTIRNQVNGKYVARPEHLSATDSWSLEYYIQEIPSARQQAVYRGVKGRREKLLGVQAEEQSKQLKTYRELLQKYSDKGRQWREEQDKIDEQLGKQLYRPLRPEDVQAMREGKEEAVESQKDA